MAYTSVITVATGEMAVAADWNTYIRDNMDYIVANRTRVLSVPCQGTQLLPDSASTQMGSWFQVPYDYVSGLTIEAVIYNSSAGDGYLNLQEFHQASGEVFSTHSSSTGYTVIALSNMRVYKLSLQLTPSNVSAGDFLEVSLARDATDLQDTISDTIQVQGFLVTYTGTGR